MKKNNTIKSCNNLVVSHFHHYGEKKLIKLRKKINEMYFIQHFSMRTIAKNKGVSRDFVTRWTQSSSQDFSEDHRGWKKGRRKKWTKADEKRIQTIFHDLKNDPYQFYLGATAIEQEWRERYKETPSPPLRTIGQILKDLELSDKRRRDRHKGASRYLCYPEYTIFNVIAKRVLELDFIGKKFITARTEPLNFIAFSFKKEPKLRYFKRISGETGDEIIKYSKLFFKKFEKPDAIKMDNGFAMAGSSPHKRVVSKVPIWFLGQGIIPIYSVPRKPFSQASIEGNNSVFSRKFWNRIDFKNVQEVTEKLEWFNKSSQKYLGYQSPKTKQNLKKEFTPKIYFIRQIREDKESQKGFINVSNEKVFLPKSYINYFVLAEWNLKEEMLYIYFEKEHETKIIKRLLFKINPKSKEKLEKIL